jgi:hypothetical protein
LADRFFRLFYHSLLDARRALHNLIVNARPSVILLPGWAVAASLLAT